MKVVQINATCGIGSTGKICVGISEVLNEKSIENYILYSSKSNGYEQGIRCSGEKYIKLQALKSRILGNYGFNSKKATRKIIDEIEKIAPDIVHLHNIHGHDCDLDMLFNYFKEKQAKLIWTFHDCWAFTGYCTYFDMVKCDKWQTHCVQCVKRNEQSWFFDKSYRLFQKKKKLFEGLDLTIVTPSRWLADVVKRSFMGDYPIHVVYNGIDLAIFKPVSSSFRQKQGLQNKKIVLGVSAEWGYRKGIDVFARLANRLSDDYQLVLVGTNPTIDKLLPKRVISIHRTQNQQELAEIYSAADVFVNPTRDEVLGLVNIESLACGTPGITFNTGGSPECYDEACGSTVKCGDVDALEKEIIRVCTEKPYTKEACIKKAKDFDQNERFKDYLEIYETIINAGDQGD